MKLFAIIFSAILSAAAVIWLFIAIPAAVESSREREASLARAKKNIERLEELKAEQAVVDSEEERQKQLMRERPILLDDERLNRSAEGISILVDSVSKDPSFIASRALKDALLEHANVFSAALSRGHKPVAVLARDKFAIAWTRLRVKAKACPTWDIRVTQIVDDICADAASMDLRGK